MPTPARRPASKPLAVAKPRLAPVPEAPPSLDLVRSLVKDLEKVASRGGSVLYDRAPQKYGFPSGQHGSFDQEIHDNLWRFNLTSTSRGLLDHFMAQHDENCQMPVTQAKLAERFECHQSKISRALGQLDKHNFAWKVRRGIIQVNPLYTYRFRSNKHHALLSMLGAETLKKRRITIPRPGGQS
ncbi:hypothetical protein [Streptomyces sp. NPDC046685]|uniref:hypothetical protein n=1 Tax=Streptomyces sp. NPDC046685 TaxID=3157202 RepID=UPI0033D724A4